VAGRTAIGLDIGTSGVRAAELSFGKGGVTLERFGQIAVPEGAVRDGEVMDTAAVASAIKQLWSHTRFSHKNVVMGVANQRVIVRQVDLPWMPAAELKESLAFQVQDFLPMPVDQTLLDFHPLEEVTGTGGARLQRGLLVAAARDMVLSNVRAVEQAGLKPIMVDLTSFAVLRSVSTIGVVDSEIEALVDIGARVTNIVVHSGGVPHFVRILLMGGQDVTDAIASNMGVTHEQAEALKHELGGRRTPTARPRPAGWQMSPRRPWSTRSAGRSTTTAPPRRTGRCRRSSSPAAARGSAVWSTGWPRPLACPSSSVTRSGRSTWVGPACPTTRSVMSSTWPQCRWVSR
jgi:type IV pilus assembly protein PilM